MEENTILARFLDGEGRITQLPSKSKARLAVLAYLAEKFDFDCSYSEKQVNELCVRWHTFGDYFLLRRELVEQGLLGRERDGSRYWRIKVPAPQVEDAQS